MTAEELNELERRSKELDEARQEVADNPHTERCERHDANDEAASDECLGCVAQLHYVVARALLIKSFSNHARALIRSAKRERLLQAEVEAWREQDAAWYGDHEGTTSDYIDQAAKADEKVDATRAALDLFDQENPA